MTTVQSLEKLETLQKVVKFLDDWRERKKKDPLLNLFFHQLVVGNVKQSKIFLEKIRSRCNSSMFYLGYVNALDGMLAALETKNNQSLFINRLRAGRREELIEILLRHSRNKLQTDFDRGFFSAWADYVQILKEKVLSDAQKSL